MERSLAADQADEPQRSNSVRSDASGTGDSEADDRTGLRRPSARGNQRSEKQAPQKWVQCAKCNLWRKVCFSPETLSLDQWLHFTQSDRQPQGLCWLQVPFTLHDEDISEDWECANNVWDKAYASCSIPQALSDNEIDNILAKQVCSWPVALLPLHPSSTRPHDQLRTVGSVQQSELEAEAALQLDVLESYRPELCVPACSACWYLPASTLLSHAHSLLVWTRWVRWQQASQWRLMTVSPNAADMPCVLARRSLRETWEMKAQMGLCGRIVA